MIILQEVQEVLVGQQGLENLVHPGRERGNHLVIINGKYNIKNLQRRKMDNWPVQRHCNSDSLSPLTVVTLKYAINITEFNLFGLLYSALQST